jgi:hypothetical protein
MVVVVAAEDMAGGDADMKWEERGRGDEGKNERCKSAQIPVLRSLSEISFGCVPLLETCPPADYGGLKNELLLDLNQGEERRW